MEQSEARGHIRTMPIRTMPIQIEVRRTELGLCAKGGVPHPMDRPHRGRSPWRWRAALLLAVGPFLVGSAPAQGDLAAAPGDGAADYRIGVEDVLRVYVLEDELLKAGTLLIVRPDGKIGFPYVKGNIRAAGRTTEELEEEIAEKLTPYIREPTVTVIVAEVNSFRVYVLGEVNEPGVIQVRRRLRVLQILALARDVT